MEPGQVLVLVGLAVVAAAVLLRAVKVVPQGRAGVVERLGRYQRTVPPGLNLVVPFVDQVRVLVDLQDQDVKLPSLVCITEDNDPLAVDTVLRYRVTDPVKAVYQVADVREALEQLTLTTLRNVVGSMTASQARSGYHELGQHLRERLPRQARDWGIELVSADVTSIRPTHHAR